MTPIQGKPSQRSVVRRWMAIFFCFFCCFLSWPGSHGLKVAATSGVHRQGLSLPARYPVRCSATPLQTPRGPVDAWLYQPDGLADAPALVMVHGVHKDGAQEARLKSFAQALAATGFAVLTPHVQSLADYQIEKSATEVIGWSAQALQRRTGRRVGVMGLSFAGGLCLMAAADKRFAPAIGYVLAVGAHDDLGRVTRFLLTGEIAAPNGETLKLNADPYGVLLLAYIHAPVLFSSADTVPAREALRFWLWGEPDRARLQVRQLSPAGQSVAEALFSGDYATVTPRLLRQLERRRNTFREVSPHDVLARIRCPVFLIHGAQDAVVPPSETRWLAQGLGDRCRVLISRAVGHVEVSHNATPLEKLEVAQFLNDFLVTARAIR